MNHHYFYLEIDMNLTFDAEHARALLVISEESTNRRPNFEQLHEPQFWRDDMAPERRAALQKDIDENGFAMDVNIDDIDCSKIPAGLWIVGDHGVYLMSNVTSEEAKAAPVAHVCYADEVNPEKMPTEEWHDNKVVIFGGDDGVEFISAEELDGALEGDKLRCFMSPSHISIYKRTTPDDPAGVGPSS